MANIRHVERIERALADVLTMLVDAEQSAISDGPRRGGVSRPPTGRDILTDGRVRRAVNDLAVAITEIVEEEAGK